MTSCPWICGVCSSLPASFSDTEVSVTEVGTVKFSVVASSGASFGASVADAFVSSTLSVCGSAFGRSLATDPVWSCLGSVVTSEFVSSEATSGVSFSST